MIGGLYVASYGLQSQLAPPDPSGGTGGGIWGTLSRELSRYRWGRSVGNDPVTQVVGTNA